MSASSFFDRSLSAPAVFIVRPLPTPVKSAVVGRSGGVRARRRAPRNPSRRGRVGRRAGPGGHPVVRRGRPILGTPVQPGTSPDSPSEARQGWRQGREPVGRGGIGTKKGSLRRTEEVAFHTVTPGRAGAARPGCAPGGLRAPGRRRTGPGRYERAAESFRWLN